MKDGNNNNPKKTSQTFKNQIYSSKKKNAVIKFYLFSGIDIVRRLANLLPTKEAIKLDKIVKNKHLKCLETDHRVYKKFKSTYSRKSTQSWQVEALGI